MRQQGSKTHPKSTKTFAIIVGQCTKRLQDKMHDDAKWDEVNKKQKLLEL
jgi:hypothetical protein